MTRGPVRASTPDDAVEVARLRALVRALEKRNNAQALAVEYGVTEAGMLRLVVTAPGGALSERELAEHIAAHINLFESVRADLGAAEKGKS